MGWIAINDSLVWQGRQRRCYPSMNFLGQDGTNKKDHKIIPQACLVSKRAYTACETGHVRSDLSKNHLSRHSAHVRNVCEVNSSYSIQLCRQVDRRIVALARSRVPWVYTVGARNVKTGIQDKKEGAKMPEYRIKVAPNTVAYADEENHKLVVEFAIPGAPTDTIDVKILEDSVHLTAPARDIEYVSALALGWPVKPDKAEATYEHGLLRIEVPFKDPMEDAVKVAIRAGGAETKPKTIEVKD